MSASVDQKPKTNRLAQVAADAISGLQRSDAASRVELFGVLVLILVIALVVVSSGELHLDSLR